MDIVQRILALALSHQPLCTATMSQFRFDLPDPALAAQAAANTQFLVQEMFVGSVGGMAASIQHARPVLIALVSPAASR